ncbi:type III secretion system needle complex protein [Salmonella enterica]|uniref:Type III secretion system needle complex protein n=1 Tax=Salmonella enterica TaxID=28901 RepID=A0A759QN16_SALER|nr:type III secretion system needle complex protein [Salmonella enterica subsp. enterica serovar Freetown]EBN9932870.1 type III secretion system needle complex protein [Salmonella enterica]EBS3610409.1 EscF/YscF/HrpA family type III secretion system needle major subunit [Salmonella enterica subsp. enterica serovar Poona]EBH8792740.1 type III secretion system needle complex protein [Salmonella enterica subsp. enterica serovar Freetown]EBP0843371.1 type III secretion system needle complex protein
MQVNSWSGYLDGVAETFDKGVNNLQSQVAESLENLAKSPSDPALLAAYQSKLSEYNLYRNAQSNTVKVFKDIGTAIIQNFR